MNQIVNLYGTVDQWDSISSKFLDGSNKLAEIPISNIDYSIRDYRKKGQGYYGALLESVKSGVAETPLNIDEICKWKSFIFEEMQKLGSITDEDVNAMVSEDAAAEFITKFQNDFEKLGSSPKEKEIIEFLSSVCFHIEEKKLFKPVSRRISHLLICYTLSYFKSPIIVFTYQDRDFYLSSTNNPLKMNLFLANKIRDAVFFQGNLLYKVGGKFASEWYKAEKSHNKRDLIIEWHELFESIRDWKEELDKSS